MFATFSASKRVSIGIRDGRVRDWLILTQLLDMYEYDYFPLRKLFRRRFLSVWVRRWRELFLYLGLLTSIVLRRGEDPLTKFVPKVSAGSDLG